MSQCIKTYIFTFLTFTVLHVAVNAQSGGQNHPGETGLNVVVIDPGHGGRDYGTSVGGLREKDIVLDIGLRLGEDIKNKFPDVKVIYTRDKDVFIPLHTRAEIANKNKADLFISIHVDYVDAKSVSGAETFILGNNRSDENLNIAKKENSVILLEDNYTTTYQGFDPNSAESYIMFETVQNEYLDQSLRFASLIEDNFRTYANRPVRGVKQAGFLVLRETTMPSVLVETGFISNYGEKQYLSSEAGRSRLAGAIFQAFSDYKNIIEERSTFGLDTKKNNTTNPDSDSGSQSVTDNFNNRRDKSDDPGYQAGNIPGVRASESGMGREPGRSGGNSGEIKVDKNVAEIWFAIQVAVTTGKVKMNMTNFKGEKNIFEIKSGNKFKYYIGRYSSYGEANEEKERINKKFDDAFVVAFENKRPIPIKEALRKTNK